MSITKKNVFSQNDILVWKSFSERYKISLDIKTPFQKYVPAKLNSRMDFIFRKL